ncbi:MAG: hypothetical protein ACI81P_001531 [Neolewinella sp.]|jgi:hypothetical protein
MNRFFTLLLSLATLLSFTGCPADLEVVPAFITIDSFDLQTPALGAATSDISEVWVFAGENNNFIGAFPLPARIPIPRSGSTDLRLEPGVKQNGVSVTPEIYEFYTPVLITLELVPGETIDIGSPVIGYRPEARFAIFETFEEGFTRAFSERVRGDTSIILTQEVVRTGAFSGKIYLSDANPLVEVASTESFSGLTDVRRYVWLEMDFRSDANGQWGVTGANGIDVIRFFDAGFRPRAEWTKVYFNLTETITESTLEEYRVNLTTLLPAELSEGEVYLDNIKLIHF